MFKTLIKKVREESSNPSILSENNTEEINGHLSKENPNSFEEVNSSPTRIHRKSSTSSTLVSRQDSSEVSGYLTNKILYFLKYFSLIKKKKSSNL